jgi:hypothetical protein
MSVDLIVGILILAVVLLFAWCIVDATRED